MKKSASKDHEFDPEHLAGKVIRLSDTFMELMAYTVHLLKSFAIGEPEAYDDVRQNYQALYQRAREQGQEEGYPEKEWQEACFAVSVWIDEMLLCSDWPEKHRWETSQFQRAYFHTTNGGEEFFLHLAVLPPGEREIREVYLYCLALGFRGRFFSPDDEDELTKIRQRNLLLMHDGEDSPDRFLMSNHPGFNDHPEMLFPEAYDLSSIPRKRPVWHYGFSPFHLLVMSVSLLLVASLFVFYKNQLAQLIQPFLGV